MSTRVFRGMRSDQGGDGLASLVESKNMRIVERIVIPDNFKQLVTCLTEISQSKLADLILTTGGTGLSKDDITPEATLHVIEKRLTGFELAMQQEGLKKTPYAILSRAVAGTLNGTLIINLPGSPEGAKESLLAIIGVMPHALRVLQSTQIEDEEHNPDASAD